MSHHSHFLSTVLNPAPPAPAASNPAPGSSTDPRPFTPAQQSLQARNKPYNSTTVQAENYEIRQRRHEAVSILESVELLMWFSMMRNESLSATRAHFTRVSLGLKPPADSIIYREEYQVPVAERLHSPRWRPSSSSRTPRKSTAMPSTSTTPKSGSKPARSAKHPRSPAPDSPASFHMEQSDSDNMS